MKKLKMRTSLIRRVGVIVISLIVLSFILNLASIIIKKLYQLVLQDGEGQYNGDFHSLGMFMVWAM